MNCYFLESTAFAKLFVQEAGTDTLIRLMESTEDNRKLIAASAPLEVYAALRRREQSGDISQENASAALEILRLEAARMVQEPLNPAVLEAARQLIDRSHLRWPDALQLGAAIVAREMFQGTEIVFCLRLVPDARRRQSRRLQHLGSDQRRITSAGFFRMRQRVWKKTNKPAGIPRRNAGPRTIFIDFQTGYKPKTRSKVAFLKKSRSVFRKLTKENALAAAKTIGLLKFIAKRRSAQIFADVGKSLLQGVQCGFDGHGIGVGNVAPHRIRTRSQAGHLGASLGRQSLLNLALRLSALQAMR